ncbi:hypothetical protein CcrC1_gp430 [Caulobacter phage C1]|nr:hypothetical protein CcrC1_gp430 [Caulobacter phage C1]UTU08659.1 hypothetical protein CcrC2_gp431 [Caulobacter phage C2]UTU10291.1 hypothetical protein CcrRB23_gp429 [Caulobacter phage RB23]WGN97325.1 hypothetical protein [Bertelyvirus sp.]WGN97844.1 hypothetical protein [Bertelyvirus sp.]
MNRTIKNILQASAMIAAILVPFVGGAYALGAQAHKAPRLEAGGFRWRGQASPPVLTKVLTMPRNNCTLYRVDTEGTRLYLVTSEDISGEAYGDLQCQITSVAKPAPEEDD